MKKTLNSALSVLIIICLLLSCACSRRVDEDYESPILHMRIADADWNDDVKESINELLAAYGTDSKTPADKPYVVFDFDNTCSIFDVEEQLAVYQIQTMAFEIDPDELGDILLTDLSDTEKDLTSFGYGNGSFSDWAYDISKAYAYLWDIYGPFNAGGLRDDVQEKIQKDPEWLEFAAKMRAMYSLVYDVESSDVAYPWVLYWFTGMKEEEIYDLAMRGFKEYKDKETKKVIWESPAQISSRTGVVKYEWTSGIQVTDNIYELWRAFDDNGIDVWVCSASCTGAIRAAIDTFDLHNYCKGLLAMTNMTDDTDKYINKYDFENGCGFYCEYNGNWERMTTPTKAQTQGKGKVTAIANAIAPEYNGHGPIAGFMDSTGDFNFCTEFETLKLVVCFNRADRKVTDGGGLIAETAVYQKDTLGYDLQKANDNGDTLYLLQGRDENGLRSLRNSPQTLKLGEKDEKLFKNEDNYTQLKKMIDDKMSVKEIFEKWSIKQAAGENGFEFDTGFLTEYSGYHSHE